MVFAYLSRNFVDIFKLNALPLYLLPSCYKYFLHFPRCVTARSPPSTSSGITMTGRFPMTRPGEASVRSQRKVIKEQSYSICSTTQYILNIYSISTQYQHNIYTISSQYLHSIYTGSTTSLFLLVQHYTIYTISTQYLHNI